MERFLFIAAGLMLLEESLKQSISSLIPWIPVRIILALFLLYYGIFGVDIPKGYKLKKILNDLRKRIGI